MTRIVFRVVIALALVGAGWSAGRAQSPVADFEFTVNAPKGTVILTCHRGCNWSGPQGQIKDIFTGEVIAAAAPNTTLYGCGAPRCEGTLTGNGFTRRR